MPSFLIKPLLIIAVFVGYTLCVYHYGYSRCQDKNEKIALEQAAENAEKVAKVIKETEEETRKLYERKIKRLQQKPLPDTCVLSPDFRRMHDTAAGLPESSEAGPVTAQVVADTVADNYESCRQNIVWLEECQRISQ